MVDEGFEIGVAPAEGVSRKGKLSDLFNFTPAPPASKAPPKQTLSAAGANDFARTIQDILTTLGDSPGGPSQSEVELIGASVREMANKYRWIGALGRFRLWLPLLVAGGMWGWRVGKPLIVSRLIKGAKPEKAPPTQRPTPIVPDVIVGVEIPPPVNDPHLSGNTSY